MRDELRPEIRGADTRVTPKSEAAPIERLTWRLADIVRALGVSRRTFERERSAGRFPKPDLHIGKAPLWRPGTVQAWIEDQARTPQAKGGGL